MKLQTMPIQAFVSPFRCDSCGRVVRVMHSRADYVRRPKGWTGPGEHRCPRCVPAVPDPMCADCDHALSKHASKADVATTGRPVDTEFPIFFRLGQCLNADAQGVCKCDAFRPVPK